MPKFSNPLAEDLDFILSHTEDVWDELKGQRVFITGGTGFFGTWLLESFCWANTRLDLGASAVVLTRNATAFAAKAPRLAADPAVGFHVGDVRDFKFPGGSFSHVIHAATSTSAALSSGEQLQVLDTIVGGTRRTLDFAVYAGVKTVLLTSSGAVYGPQPSDLTHIPETYKGAPDTMDPASAYGEGKRVAELLCSVYNKQHHIQTKIARCFAFVGPHLPLDAHFAIGNFVGDFIAGNDIRVQGDGRPFRSYLYAADLMIWLWTILFRGRACYPYNVGSENDLSILEIASTVARSSRSARRVWVFGQASNGVRSRYVPSTARIREDLHLNQLTPLEMAIDKTIAIQRLS